MKSAIIALVLAATGVLALGSVATAATSAPTSQQCADAKAALANLKASYQKNPNPLVAHMIAVYTQQVKNSCGG
jgi:hypothetical protein